jgi:hypothetical protein
MGSLGEWIEIGEIERSSSEGKNEVVAGDNGKVLNDMGFS